MTLDSLIDPGSSLGELIAERPARAQLFERLRLDYCCGGRQTLAAACAKRGLELDQVRAALTALDERDLHSTGVESRDTGLSSQAHWLLQARMGKITGNGRSVRDLSR